MSFSVWLRLGRVSNLPTVWSNSLTGIILAPGALASLALSSSGASSVAALAGIFSLFYVGGMYLNDAFDRHIDAVERPARPIPSGRAAAGAVFAIGFGALALGTLLLAAVAGVHGVRVGPALGSGALLSALIVGYDLYHKQNPLSPLLMGACRVMIYVSAAYAVSAGPSAELLLGAAALWCHLIGLTYAAKQEAFNRITRLWPLAFLAAPVAYGVVLGSQQTLVWPFLAAHTLWVAHALSFLRAGPKRSVPGAVVRLIAGISLLDAVLIAAAGAAVPALLAALLCALTRLLQRYVPGT